MEWENNKLDFSHCSHFTTGPSERDRAVTNQQTGSHYGFSSSAEFVSLRLFLQSKPGRRWKDPSLQPLSAVPGNKVWRTSEEQRAQRLGTHFKASEKWALRVKRRKPPVPLEAENPSHLRRRDSPVDSFPRARSLRELSSVLKWRWEKPGAAGFPLLCPRFNQSLCALLTRKEHSLSVALVGSVPSWGYCRV